MSERKSQVNAAPSARSSRHGAASSNPQAAAVPGKLPVMDPGLRDFMYGQEDLGTAERRIATIHDAVEAVINDQLLQSADAVFEAAIFGAKEMCADTSSFLPLYALCSELRALQHIRLRDAIARINAESNS